MAPQLDTDSPVPDQPDDRYMLLREAARLFPGRRPGKSVAVQTLYRHATVGVRGVVLQTAQVGGSRCTTRRWVREFVAALTSKRDGQPASERTPPCVRRRRHLERVDAELTARGL